MNSYTITFTFTFVVNKHDYNTMRSSSYREVLRGYATVIELYVLPSINLSVCLSVTFKYRDHIGWNTYKFLQIIQEDRLLL